MKTLSCTQFNLAIIQHFIDETKKRISDGVTITFTQKAQSELSALNIDYDITVDDIENAIFSLTTENYSEGIDPSLRGADFKVCAFYTEIGADEIGIYLKYGLEANGLQILVFSNHAPIHPMNQPFKN